jgi:transposase InsO family protein
VNVYPFIEAERAEQRSVKAACALLEVSRTAYYDWSKHVPSNREREDQALTQLIKKAHERSRGTYGAPRVHATLRRDGILTSTKRVARLMRTQGLEGRRRRRFKRTTIADPAAAAAADLLTRSFAPDHERIDRAWCSDITYVRTWEGWLYCCAILDLGSRRVVGWAMADHMRASLVCDALDMAVRARRPKDGLIFHADRGSQYTSGDLRRLLERHEMVQSLAAPGQCWDNAVAESFWSTLKEELVYRHAWPTRARARQAIFEFIEVFYNRQRLHSSLGYLSPAEYEARRGSGQSERSDAA